MTLEEVYQFFGSANQACKSLGISRQNFCRWNKIGYIPLVQQLRLEKITKGKLMANESHALKKEPSTKLFLPAYRYFDKKFGMCFVESLHFKLGMKPKITYLIPGNRVKKVSTFDFKGLMKALDLKDSLGNTVYEGDIVKTNHETLIVIERDSDISLLHDVKIIEIIGHIYDGEKSEC